MVEARGQKVAQVRDGKYSRALQLVGSGGDVSAWLWIGSGGGGWEVQNHGGSLWGETRISEGLNLEVSAPVTPTSCHSDQGEGRQRPRREFGFPAHTEQRGLWGDRNL